jgi:hypothetical protein
MYAYVKGDPVNRVDPSGTSRITGSICGVGDPCTINGVDHHVLLAELQHWAMQRLAAIPGALKSCTTSSPADICGMVRDQSPQAVETMRALVNDPKILREMAYAVARTGVYDSGSRRNEAGLWIGQRDDHYFVVERRGGLDNAARFHPKPSTGSIFFHVHPFLMAERYVPGISPQDMYLGITARVMMVVWNVEQKRFWWQDYRVRGR